MPLRMEVRMGNSTKEEEHSGIWPRSFCPQINVSPFSVRSKEWLLPVAICVIGVFSSTCNDLQIIIIVVDNHTWIINWFQHNIVFLSLIRSSWIHKPFLMLIAVRSGIFQASKRGRSQSKEENESKRDGGEGEKNMLFYRAITLEILLSRALPR